MSVRSPGPPPHGGSGPNQGMSSLGDDDEDDKPKPPPPKPKPPTPGKPSDPSHHPKTVTVVKWTKHNTPWNSTLWGIAHHEHVKGGWQYLQKINHLKGDPKKALKPGVKIKLSA